MYSTFFVCTLAAVCTKAKMFCFSVLWEVNHAAITEAQNESKERREGEDIMVRLKHLRVELSSDHITSVY